MSGKERETPVDSGEYGNYRRDGFPFLPVGGGSGSLAPVCAFLVPVEKEAGDGEAEKGSVRAFPGSDSRHAVCGVRRIFPGKRSEGGVSGSETVLRGKGHPGAGAEVYVQSDGAEYSGGTVVYGSGRAQRSRGYPHVCQRACDFQAHRRKYGSSDEKYLEDHQREDRYGAGDCQQHCRQKV